MNFNLILFSLLLILLTACGVKGDPTFPAGATVPSLMDQYPDIKTDQPIGETKSPTGKSTK